MLLVKPPGRDTTYDQGENFDGNFDFIFGCNDKGRYEQWKLIHLTLRRKSISIELVNDDSSGNGQTNLSGEVLYKMLQNHDEWN